MAAIQRPFPQARRRIPLPLGLGGINPWVMAAFAVLALGAMLPVLQNATATTRGFDVQRIEAQQARVRGDIAVLQTEVAELTSLSRIALRARELGLGPPLLAPIYINVDVPGPEPAKLPSQYLPGLQPFREAPEPWWRSLLSWVTLGM